MSEELDNIDILNSEVCNYFREGNAQIFFYLHTTPTFR